MWIRNGWSAFLDPDLLAAMNDGTVWIGNLETPISESFEVPSSLPSYLEFNSAPELIRAFRKADGSSLFGALSYANNHTLDFGDVACEDTLAFLEAEGIPTSGARADAGPTWATFTAGGLRFGFYAATWGLNDAALLEGTGIKVEVVAGLAPEGEKPVDLSGVRAALAEMEAAGVDFKIVYLHWGHEYEMYPSPIQLRAAREIVYAGADLIVGAHPHVAQPAEACFVNGYQTRLGDAAVAGLGPESACVLEGAPGRPRKALVLYSLGNFTTALVTNPCRLGLMLRLNVFTTADGTDWTLGEAGFAWNLNEYPPAGEHRLLPLDAFMDADCAPEQTDGCGRDLRDDLAYQETHLNVWNGK